MENVAASLCQIITDEVEFPRPRLRVKKSQAVKNKAAVTIKDIG